MEQITIETENNSPRDGLLEKTSRLMRLANEASTSKDIVMKIGAVTLYAGIVDFLTFQFARCVEQVMLKSQLAAGEKPKFAPSTDEEFYDKRIDSRKIVNEVKKNILPFKNERDDTKATAEKLNKLAKELISKTNKFLDCRIDIIHRSCSPKITFEELHRLCDKTISVYKEFREAHTVFFETIQPFTFSEKEREFFYGNKDK